MVTISAFGKNTSIWQDTAPETDYPRLKGDIKTDIAIVGGGISGLMTAYFLINAGFKVVVFEAGKIVEGTTGFTSAKITSAHGLVYKYLIDKFGSDRAQIYANANQAAIEKVAEIVKKLKIDCDFKRMSAYTYASTDGKFREEIIHEVAAAKNLGLPVSFVKDVPLPFKTFGAIKYANQAQYHPKKYLLAIAAEINKAGSQIYEKTTVLDIKENGQCEVICKEGNVRADKVVIATNHPIYDPKKVFSHLPARQSFVLGARLDGRKPASGMFYSVGEKSFHSLRPQRWRNDEDIQLIGGEVYHDLGKVDAEKSLKILADWAKENFTIKSFEYNWTTSDTESPDRVPIIGRLDPAKDNIFVITAFSGWGMAHSHVAAMILAEEIKGRSHPWSKLYSPDRLLPKSNRQGFLKNLEAVGKFIEGRIIKAPTDYSDLKNGDGKIIEYRGKKTAVYKDDRGEVRAISAVCTHMGCIVGWNKTEKTWDCPCHGSRYSADGEVIHGPAPRSLERIDLNI
jgi:glycine/D-amino acid oxidase-like deaminating enzyme/nitrite reductase/ring-hydroxylating ferredoxin subunit